MCQRGEQNKLMKDLGISDETFRCWKKEFGLPFKSKFKYSYSEKLEVMRKYYKIKQRNPKIRDIDIANILNIEKTTLYRWKKQFVNFVDDQSLPENHPTFADNDTSEHQMASSANDNLWSWNLAKKKRTERTEVEHSVNKNMSDIREI
uniref:Transposase n=1 Tax=Globodera rostochiensis TaxID=31243 RepID=A0A914H8S1_GLORO